MAGGRPPRPEAMQPSTSSTKRMSAPGDAGVVDRDRESRSRGSTPPKEAWPHQGEVPHRAASAAQLPGDEGAATSFQPLPEDEGGDGGGYTAAELGLGPHLVNTFAVNGERRLARWEPPPGVPDDYQPYEAASSEHFTAFTDAAHVDNLEYTKFVGGVLRKLEAFREKLKATLHYAGGQTLHPLLRTRLLLHFTHRLDSSTLNVFKAAPTPRPTWVYARARVDGPAAAKTSTQRSTVAVGATDSKLTAVALIGRSLQEMEVGLCALVLGHCACDSVACTVSLFAVGFHRLVEASTSPGSLDDAVDLLKLQDGASLEALLREEANMEAAIAGALPEAVYITFGFSMVAVMTEVYGVRRFLELARSRMRAHPYHVRQGKAVGPASVTMYALNDITTLVQQRLGDHYDTTALHWKSIVESLSPDVAREIYETKAATKRNRNSQVAPSDVPVVEEVAESLMPSTVLWPMPTLPARKEEVTVWTAIQFSHYWLIKNEPGSYWRCALLQTTLVGIAVAKPLLVDLLFNEYIPTAAIGNTEFNSSIIILGALLALGVMGTKVNKAMQMLNPGGNTFVCTVQAALCKHVCGLDQEYLEAMGDRMQEHLVENVVGDIDLSISALFELFGTILLLFALFITLITLSWQLTLLLCCTLPVYVFVSNKGVEKIEAALNKLMMDRLVFLTKLRENIKQSKVRRVLELWGMMDELVDEDAAEFERSLLHSLLLKETNKENSSLMGEVKQTFIIGLGAVLVVTGTTSLGTLLAFYIATYAIDGHALALLKAYTQFLGSKEMIWHFVSVVRVPTRKFLNAKSKPEDLTIDVRNLDFCRPIGTLDLSAGSHRGDMDAASPMRAILSSVDFKVPPGLKVGIIGKSGTGKSTFLKLLARLYEPTRGTISYGAIDKDKVFFSKTVAYMDQEPLLFNGSIEYNITMGTKNFDPHTVREAMHTACLTWDIDNIPKGLETIIGALDSELHLSFGQRQRVALARTLFRNTPILLLDEPSSAQEPATVAEIGRNLLSLRYRDEQDGRQKPCTVLAVTHNMDMLKFWNWTALFIHGTIAEYGEPQEMLARRGQYYHIISKMQAIQTGPDGLPKLSPALLLNSWLFSYCTEAQVESVASKFLVRQCRDGDYVVSAGKTCDCMVVLASGHIEEIHAKYDTKKLWELGDTGGKSSLARSFMRDDKPITWSKSLRSRGETMVLQLGAVQFEHMLRRDIVLQDKVLQAVQMVEEYRNTKAIQSIWPFALCTPGELEELLRCFECETIHAQTRMFDARNSNPCRAVYYVLSGELRVTQLVPGPDGRPTETLNSYYSGSFVGEQNVCGLDEMHDSNLISCSTGNTRCVLLTLRESHLLAMRKQRHPMLDNVDLSLRAVKAARTPAEVARRCWLLATLPDRVLDHVSALLTVGVYGSHLSLIAQETADKDTCFLVVSGRVMVIRKILNSDDHTIIEVGPGGAINVTGLVGPGLSRVVCAFTTATTIVLACSRRMLFEAMAAQKSEIPLLQTMADRWFTIRSAKSLVNLLGPRARPMRDMILAGCIEIVLGTGDVVSQTAHNAKKRDKDAQRIKKQKHVNSELPKIYTVLSGAISGHVTGGNSGGQQVELVPGDSFWMPAQFTDNAQKPVAGYSLDFARASRQYTILVAMSCDLQAIEKRCFQGMIKAPGLVQPISCLGLFTTHTAFKGIQEMAEIVRRREQEIAELWPQIKALEVRLGWRKPFRVRNAWREVLRQIKVMRAFNPNAKFSLREAGANEQKGSLEDILTSTQHHLKFVQREVKKREELIADQLVRWRKLGYTPNPWQMMARSLTRLVAKQAAAKSRPSVAPQSNLIQHDEEELFIDSDDSHDLTMHHIQVIDAQLAKICARRQERMERFRDACRKIWTELKTSDDDRAQKEAEWVVEDQTELPGVIQKIHMEMMRLEGDFMAMYLKTKSKLTKLSDKLNIPNKFLNPILRQEREADEAAKEHEYRVAMGLDPPDPPEPVPDPDAPEEEQEEEEVPLPSILEIEERIEEYVGLRTDLAQLQLTAPLLAAKDVQVVELHALMKLANKTMEEAFKAAKNLLAGPVRDDETETSSQTGREGVVSRGEMGSAKGAGSSRMASAGVGSAKGASSRGSSAAGEAGRYDHEKVMQTQIALLTSATEELKQRLVDEQTRVIEEAADRKAKTGADGQVLQNGDIMEAKFTLKRGLKLINKDAEVKQLMVAIDELWALAKVHPAEKVMYVRQMQGADMRGREDLVAELTDHVEMIEDKLRSAAESEARKEVYVELVEEDTAKAAIQIKQLKELLDIREPPEEEGAAPLPVSGEFARAEEALTMRAELERLQTEAASKEREREVLVRTVQATLDEMASIRMPPLDPTLPLAHNLEREIAAPLGDDALDELRDQGQELRHQLSTEYRRRHGKEMKVALKLLEDLGAAESEKARFRKNNQVEEDGDGLMLARQLSTVQAKVKEFETRKQLQQLTRALVTASGLWETLQVEEAQRAVLFKELGSSTGEAKVRIDAELKSMQERHGEADEMRTLYIEEAQVAWKKLKVSGPGTERFLAEFGHSVYPPTMLELQKYSGILKKAVEMATLKADLELFKAELKEAAAMPQNNKVLKDEKKKRIRLLKKQKRVAVKEMKVLRAYSKQELEELKANRKMTNIIGRCTKKNIKKELGLVLPHFAPALQLEDPNAKNLSRRLFPQRRR